MQPKTQSPSTKQTKSAHVELCFNGVTYAVQDMLGSGVTSDVYKATALPFSNGIQPSPSEAIAVKHVKDCCRKEFANEVAMQTPLQHPHIVGVKGHQAQPGGRQLIALEYCQYELFDIVKEISGFTEDIGRFFFAK